MIRFVFKLPSKTHRYLLEPISGTSHLVTKLTNRFMKFYSSLCNNNKAIVRNLKYIQECDNRSEFGANVQSIYKLNNVYNMSSVKPDSILYHPIPDNEKWRLPILKEIIDILNMNLYVDFDDTDVKFLLNFIACS